MDSAPNIYQIYVSLLVIRNSYDLNMRRSSFHNIKFNYLFRDARNYKSFGFVVLSNPGGKSPEEIDGDLRRCLIDGTYFYPEQVQLPVLDESEEGLGNEYENVESDDEYGLKVRTLCAAGVSAL